MEIKTCQPRILADTRGMDRAHWLEYRRMGIGGSDAAAIVGMNPWSSPWKLWAEKTGRLPEEPENERMRLGRELEEYVARRFCELTDKRVRRRNAILQHPEHDWMIANVDRLVVGENAGLECKTTSNLKLRQTPSGDFPEQYYCQCVHYMAVTGMDRWYLCVLVLGSGEEPMVYCLERNEGEINALIQAEKDFWFGHIQTDIPPAVDGADATTEALGTVYAEAADEEAELTNGQLLEDYAALKAQKKALDEAIAQVEQAIKADMKDASRAIWNGWRVTWEPAQRKTLDTKALMKDHPGIDYGRYYKVTDYRRFAVKEVK